MGARGVGLCRMEKSRSMKHLMWVLWACFVPTTMVFSQASPQTEALLESVEQWVGNQHDDELKWLKREFRPWLEDGAWRSGQIDTLYATVESFKQDRISYIQGGRGYLEAAQYLMSEQDTVFWQDWHRFIAQLQSKRNWKKKLPNFLMQAKGLFASGTLAEDASSKWQLVGGRPNFETDSVPLVRFVQGDLVGTARGDRVAVVGTEGYWDVLKDEFVGGPGRVTWAGTLLDSTTHYAEFDAYEVRLGGNSFSVESARFYSEFVPDVLPGRLTVKLQNHSGPEDKDYPRFETQQSILDIPGIAEGVNYRGGLTINGSRMLGTGTLEDWAQLEVIHEDTLLFRLRALTYLFTDRGISAETCRAELYYREDTISHPACQFRLDHATGRLMLSRVNEGLGAQPFVDNYHDLELDVEALRWERGSSQVVLGGIPGATNRTATFSSSEYFKREAFQSLQGLADRHPLQLLKEFEQATGMNQFSTLDFADFIRLNELSTRIMLIDLANQGFLNMDLETRMCELTSKTSNYLRNAAGKRDFDVIQFISQAPNGINGAISLLNGRLKLEGVSPFQVSDSQDVRVLPEAGQIEVGENRSFTFNGRVLAGNLELIGTGFTFDYEEFEIELQQVEEVKMMVDDPTTRDRYGRPEKVRVQSSLRQVTGTLKIDDPRNRSGLKSRQFAQYPMLSSKETAYIYYDEARIQDGAYDRDRFYFAVSPFTMNNLDRFEPEDLRFEGTLVSAGILPDLDQPVQLMPDFSLGISTETTSAGKELYGGLARYTKSVQLDLMGLHGGGVIDFKSAHAEGTDFTFLPDEAIGVTTVFRNRSDEALDVPFVDGDGGKLFFAPYEGRLTCSTGRDSIVAFNPGVKFRGEVTLVDSGFFASGGMVFDDAKMQAQQFQWTQHHALSDSCSFSLLGFEGRLALQSDALKADVNFKDRLGEFAGCKGEMSIDLPLNQYEVVMDRFRWFMDTDQIALETDRQFPEGESLTSDLDIPSNFLSLHPGQDSLQFLSPKARYDLMAARIDCKEVKLMEVADAEIWPDSGRITIQRLAAMEPLEHASVVANRTSRLHRITDATLEIRGRLDYQGHGNYIYKDLNGTPFEVHFSKVFVDEAARTRARGVILSEDDFTLSPAFAYAGEVFLDAEEPLLRFHGGAQMMHTCLAYEPEWIDFDARIDPRSVAIPILEEVESIDRQDLTSGVMVSGRSPYTAYPAFLTERGNRDDRPLIAATGALRHDAKGQRYVISEADKFANADALGNLTELAVNGCGLRSEGEVTLPVDYGLMTHAMVGETWVDDAGQMHAKGTVALDFHFDDKLLERIASQIPMWSDSKPLDVFAAGYDLALRTMVGEEEAEEALSDLGLSGRFRRVPKSLQHTMVFSGLEFVYDPQEDSFITEGDLGLVLLGGEQVFMTVRGKMEIQRLKTGDWFRLYLHGGAENWYYMDYRLGTFNISTTDQPFFDILLEVKAKNRTIKLDGKRFGFQAMGSKKRRNDFVDRFREFD